MLEYIYMGVAITSYVFLSALGITIVFAGIAYLISIINTVISQQAEYRATKYRAELVSTWTDISHSNLLNDDEKQVWEYLQRTFHNGGHPYAHEYQKQKRVKTV